MRSVRVRIVALLLTAGLVASSPARAQTVPPVPVLLELFTSEGCSSCPPADDLLQNLDRTQPVPGAHLIVLSEHVDYWNTPGWKDPFSSAQFTARQSSYVSRIDASRGVYTPELVVDGRESVVGSDDGAVSAAISRALTDNKRPLSIDRVMHKGDTIAMHIVGGAPDEAAELYVAVAYDSARSHVTAGENAGRTLTHAAVVHTLVQVGAFSPEHKVEQDVVLRQSGSDKVRLVAFLQDKRTGAVLELAERPL